MAGHQKPCWQKLTRGFSCPPAPAQVEALKHRLRASPSASTLLRATGRASKPCFDVVEGIHEDMMMRWPSKMYRMSKAPKWWTAANGSAAGRAGASGCANFGALAISFCDSNILRTYLSVNHRDWDAQILRVAEAVRSYQKRTAASARRCGRLEQPIIVAVSPFEFIASPLQAPTKLHV